MPGQPVLFVQQGGQRLVDRKHRLTSSRPLQKVKGTLNTSRQLSRALEEGTSAMVPRMAWYAPMMASRGIPYTLTYAGYTKK